MKDNDTPKPLTVKQWRKALQARPPSRAREELLLRMHEFALPKTYRNGAAAEIDHRRGTIELSVRTRTVGQHFFPPNIACITARRRQGGESMASATNGALHEHLGVSTYPRKLPRELRVRQRFLSSSAKRRGRRGLSDPTALFSPDDRYVFSDTSFPWCTCGLVETEAGWGSGVMIGPRHIMTASHVVVWKPNNTAGWVKFTPLKFDNSEPFGHAFATLIYSWNKADGSDQLDLTEGAFDYVVCVLDSAVGNTTGWQGSRGYDTSWNNGDFWGHIGYPSDLSGGTRPTFVGFQRFIGEDSASLAGHSSLRIKHRIDVIPGQSGGPYSVSGRASRGRAWSAFRAARTLTARAATIPAVAEIR